MVNKAVICITMFPPASMKFAVSKYFVKVGTIMDHFKSVAATF